jgi:hypothetical protein
MHEVRRRFHCYGCVLRMALLVVAGGVMDAAAAAPTPVIFQSGPGRFEVAAIDAADAKALTSAADDAWRTLATPLVLPDSFSSPIFVRVIPAEDWKEPAPFHALVEPGGVVSLRIGAGSLPTETFVRRAVVQALLLRLAVARHGVNDRLTAPLWLELACVGWWQTRADAAQLDALRQASAHLAAPGLADLLGWQRGGGEPPAWSAGAVWLLGFLQGEGAKEGEWPAFLRRLLGGEEPLAALAATYPGRFSNAGERELWWQTGWHHLRRVRSLPTLEAAESRVELEALTHFVFNVDGADKVLPLADVLMHRDEPPVKAEVARRAIALGRIVASLHPFYRNAGLSLAEVFDGRGMTRDRAPRLATFERDWQDAVELEQETTSALDALEQRPAR